MVAAVIIIIYYTIKSWKHQFWLSFEPRQSSDSLPTIGIWLWQSSYNVCYTRVFLYIV